MGVTFVLFAQVGYKGLVVMGGQKTELEKFFGVSNYFSSKIGLRIPYRLVRQLPSAIYRYHLESQGTDCSAERMVVQR